MTQFLMRDYKILAKKELHRGLQVRYLARLTIDIFDRHNGTSISGNLFVILLYHYLLYWWTVLFDNLPWVVARSGLR